MEALILYFGKMILCSALMFGYYHLALRNRTFHHYNRFYLLSAVLVSILLPLLKVSYFTMEMSSDIYRLFAKFNSTNPIKTNNDDFLYYRLIIVAFGLVSLFILGRFMLGILKINKFKKQFPKEEAEGISFYQTNLENAPFSFFKNLFWKNSILVNSDLGRQILKHEMVHIEQKHTHDKIFMELATGIFWFNPVFWFIKKEINLIHEYLADKKAVKHMDTKAFAQMLLASHFSGTVIPATSPFLNSNLKKRLKMLQKPKTKFGYAHRILALPLVFTLAFVYAVNAKNKEIEKTNKEIEARLSETRNDTIKKSITAKLVEINDSERSDYNAAKNASEQALFIIGAKEVSKSEFLDFVEKNKFNRDMVTSYLTYSTGNTGDKLFGERGDLGVYRAQLFSAAESERGEYRKLIEKYNPDWSNNPSLKNEVKRSETAREGAGTILQPGSEKDAKENVAIAEQVKRDPAQAVKDAKAAATEAENAAKERSNAIKESEEARKEAVKASLESRKAAEESAKAALEMNKAKLAAEKASIESKNAEGAKQNSIWIINTSSNENPKKIENVISKTSYSSRVTFMPSIENSTILKHVPEAKIFIDGLAVNHSEFNKLDPRNINSIRIFKKGFQGKTENEMHIETKKIVKISQ